MFLLVIVAGSLNAVRETPVYRARTQLMIDKDTPTVATLDQMFQSQDGWYNDDFYQTQYRILQSRSLARRAHRPDAAVERAARPRPEPKMALDPLSLARTGASKVYHGVKSIVGDDAPPQVVAEPRPVDETAMQSAKIDEFRGGVRDRAGPQQPPGGHYLHVNRPGVRGTGGQRPGEGLHRAKHGVPVQRIEGCD